MGTRKLIGMITPSLNTVLEPVTYALLRDLPDVTAHFTRVRVTEISLGESSSAQFAPEPMLEAARLLADAHVDVICWNGTSGGWLGMANDAKLCAAISAETGIPATSSTQATNAIFSRMGVRRFGLVTPYRDDVQEAIIENYRGAGFDCVGEAHLDRNDGYAFAAIDPEILRGLVRQVAESQPQAITIMCTNVDGAHLAEAMEAETGVPLYDSVAVTLWHALILAGVDPAQITHWGRLFEAVQLPA